MSTGGLMSAPVIYLPGISSAVYAQVDAKQYFDQGVKLIKANKLQEAMEAFRKVISAKA